MIEISENSLYNKINEFVEDVVVMIFVVILLVLALPTGIYLMADLLQEQHRTTTQNNQ